MNRAYIVYRLAYADFLDRIRRYSFLIMLGAVLFLAYQIAIDNLTLQLEGYRGEFNSAWVGSLMSLMGTFFLGWFGFYLVKGSIQHDRKTGVGQILASTPMTRGTYMFGKWVSNFSILTLLNLILVVTGIGIQLVVGENTQFDLVAMLAPFLFITLPVMALTASMAIFFESVKFLSGVLGNIVYFFLFIGLSDSLGRYEGTMALEPMGMALIQQSTWAAAKAAYPHFNGGFVIDFQSRLEPVEYIFHWPGIDWTPELIFKRLVIILVAILLTFGASRFFDRFATSGRAQNRVWATLTRFWQNRRKKSIVTAKSAPLVSVTAVSNLTPLSSSAYQFSFIHLLNAELKLLLKRQPWWWFIGAFVLSAGSGVVAPPIARAFILLFAWVWPIAIWSGMGNRDLRYNVRQLTFSAAYPLQRQLPAQWLAGFIIAFGMGFGAFLHMLTVGDVAGLMAYLAAALFIPSLALCCGVLSGNNKLFEVLYIVIWYLGPVNQLFGLDYIGTQGGGRPQFFISLSLLLIVLAVFRRKWQLTS